MSIIGRLRCLLGDHRWNRPVVFQMPTCRIVGRVCTRPSCSGVKHTVALVWSEPAREAITECGVA